MIHVFLAGLINHPMHLVLERRKFLAVSTEDLLKADFPRALLFIMKLRLEIGGH